MTELKIKQTSFLDTFHNEFVMKSVLPCIFWMQCSKSSHSWQPSLSTTQTPNFLLPFLAVFSFGVFCLQKSSTSGLGVLSRLCEATWDIYWLWCWCIQDLSAHRLQCLYLWWTRRYFHRGWLTGRGSGMREQWLVSADPFSVLWPDLDIK